jgi:hypothetical protein
LRSRVLWQAGFLIGEISSACVFRHKVELLVISRRDFLPKLGDLLIGYLKVTSSDSNTVGTKRGIEPVVFPVRRAEVDFNIQLMMVDLLILVATEFVPTFGAMKPLGEWARGSAGAAKNYCMKVA